MAAYIVLSPENGDSHDPENRFVKDGFSWTAALFPFFWAIIAGLFADAAVLFVIRMAGFAMASTAGLQPFGWIVIVASSLIYGFEARNRYAARLAGKGWVWQTAIAARNLDEAEAIYYAGAEMPAPKDDPVFKFDPDFSGKPVSSPARQLSFGLINMEKGRR